MAAESNPNLHFRELSEMFARLDNESDRAVALIVTAWIDDSLTEMIKTRLFQDKKKLELMFGPSGPFGTFSSKITMAFLMGRISKTVFNNLETIRKIRNDFAHSRGDLSFSSESVNDRCKNLFLKGFKRVKESEFSPRDAFIATGMGLTGFFIEFVSADTISDNKGDLFPSFMKYIEQDALNMIAKFTN